jgi:hypothetical protein
VRREVLGIPFFAAAAAGALAAVLTSHPSASDAGWLIGGAMLGTDSAVRFARKHHRMRTSGGDRPTDWKRTRAVATFSAGLGVFASAVLPRKAWLAIFAYAAMASLMVAVYYGWYVATARRGTE